MIHVFGNLWLPAPEKYLPMRELLHVKELLHFIQAFKVQHAENATKIRDASDLPGWNIDQAFDRFRRKEVAWWNERGVIRPIEYLVRPSGRLNAAVACHLYNPTFCVDDPCYEQTEDLSNSSLAQLSRAGFSSENDCLIFDHLARRDISRHCNEIYPQDLIDIHEDFVFALRETMGAKIEICWGSNVRQRMQNKLELQPFRLWGELAGLTLYLEMTPDKSAMKRFIIFVAHPQRFLYVKSDGERARSWRRQFGVSQDRALSVAAQLGGIQISQNFYELDPRLPQNLCVSRKVSNQRNAWKGQAAAQLKQAFPEAVISTESSHSTRPTKEDKKALQEGFNQLRFGQVDEAANTPNTIDDTNLRNVRLRKIAEYWQDLSEMISEFVPHLNTDALAKQHLNAKLVDNLLESISASLQESDCWNWEDLPDPVAEFIQVQDGLKFNKQKISCRSHLELAFHLLQHCTGNPATLNILMLAFWVLISYGWMITRPRRPSVDELLILREPPNDVVPRKCSACSRDCLDDPFAYWSKYDSNCYVFWYHSRSSCGRPDCKARRVNLLPFNDLVRRTMATRKTLEEKSLEQFSKWFLLRPEEFKGLPVELEVQCQGEGCDETRTVNARWTAHKIPRFVIAVHKCTKHHKRTNWLPTSIEYPTVNSANLGKLWKTFHEVPGFDITSHPRRPDIYFNKDLSVSGRIAALIEAQRLVECDRLVNGKRKVCQIDIQ